MTKINNSDELQARIIELQVKGKEEGIALKEEISDIIDNVHPIQLLTHGLKEIIKSPEVKNELLGLSVGMSAGYITKKLIIGKSDNAVQNIAGNILGMVVSKNIALNSDKIQSTVFNLLKSFVGKKKTSE
jgi:hypothetical protein